MRTHNEVWDVGFYDCSSCGTYGIHRTTQLNYKHCVDERERASHLAAERFIHDRGGFVLAETDDSVLVNVGVEYPVYKLQTFLGNYPKDSIEILDRTLLNIAQLEVFPGDALEIIRAKEGYPQPSIAFTNNWNLQTGILLLLEVEGTIAIQQTWSNTSSGNEPNRLEKERLLRNSQSVRIRIQPEGLRRIRFLKTRAAGDQPQAFVAMWFHSSRDKFFSYIEKAAKEAGFDECLRIDNKETNNKICDEIIAEIRKSQCLIADFTGNRGGVYFEAGFALGLGIPVIWLVDANWWNETDKNGKRINDLHFDTRQYAHIDYKDENDLYKRLKARIEATVPIRKS